MKLFEDIIDNNAIDADDESSSTVVGKEDEDFYVFRTPKSSTELNSQYKFTFNAAISVDKETVVKLSTILYHILESTSIVDDFSTIYISECNTNSGINYINIHVWFNLLSNPLYEQVLNFIISVNNVFFNTKLKINNIRFFGNYNENVLNITPNSRLFSLYYYFDTFADDDDNNNSPEALTKESSYMEFFNNFMQVFYNKKYNISNPFAVYKGLYDSVKSININNIRISNR